MTRFKIIIIFFNCFPIAGLSQGQVELDSLPDYRGQPSYIITTPSAVYVYHKSGAGFASLLDRDSLDWISYNPGSGASGEYRGIPNLVYQGGSTGKDRAFHPGHTGEWASTTFVMSQSGSAVRLRSISNEGEWECIWALYATHAEMTVVKGTGKYWFLYEGTPNGAFNGQTNYLLRPDWENRHSLDKATDDDDIVPASGETWEWIAFGDENTSRTLFLVHHEDDKQGDRYRPMAPMTVFGFGRTGSSVRALSGFPRHFTIGICNDSSKSAVQKHIRAIMTQSPSMVQSVPGLPIQAVGISDYVPFEYWDILGKRQLGIHRKMQNSFNTGEAELVFDKSVFIRRPNMILPVH